MKISDLSFCVIFVLEWLVMPSKATVASCYYGSSTQTCSCSGGGGSVPATACYIYSSAADLSNSALGCLCDNRCAGYTAVSGTDCVQDGSGNYYYCCTSDNCNNPNSGYTCSTATTTASTTTKAKNSASKQNSSNLFWLSSALSLFVTFMFYY